MIRPFFILLVLIIPDKIQAQHEIISIYKDSLSHAKDHQEYWYGLIAREYLKQTKNDSAKFFYYKALENPTIERQYQQSAYVYNNLGYLYQITGKMDSAIFCYTRSYQLYTLNGNKKEAGYSELNLGIVYKDLAHYALSLEHLFSSENYFYEENDLRGLSSCYNTIGSVYSRQGDFEKALNFHRKSLRLRNQLKSPKLISASYNNIGTVFRHMKLYDSAMVNYEKSLLLKNKVHDDAGKGAIYNNMGIILLGQGDYISAKRYLEDSYKIKASHSDMQGVAIALNNLGLLNLRIEDFESSMMYIFKANEIIRENGFLDELRDNLQLALKILIKQNKYKEALLISQELLKVKDSILNREKTRAIVEMQTIYETEKKQQEIVLLEKNQMLQASELELRQTWIFFLLIGTSFLIVAGLVAVRQWRKEKFNKAKIETLLKELHHRVKNNLQLLSSIFQLNIRKVSDHKALETLKSSENRVNAMAIIHQRLYKPETRSIEIGSYIKDLAMSICDSYGIDYDSLDIKVVNVDLDVDKVTPLGLIFTELISNSIKYSSDLINTKILVKLEREGNSVILNVKDNGPGFSIKNISEKSMGLRIIETLSREIGATIKWETEGFVHFYMKMNING